MVHRGTHPSFSPFSLLLCFCADEIKDDFDALGPDATLQAVGNGTGELTEDVIFVIVCCSVYFLSLCHAFKQSVPIFLAYDLLKGKNMYLQHFVTGYSSLFFQNLRIANRLKCVFICIQTLFHCLEALCQKPASLPTFKAIWLSNNIINI